ncbi:MAG TPA: HlyD family type I secretion periplasmic adaptor subunit [Acetobacteraceae bacterium]|nr:HlyD family type I secretion periplasmic adaptor subunit [Acetobacteraceae bacterium]
MANGIVPRDARNTPLALLEFQSPTAAVIATPVPRAIRSMGLIICAMVACLLVVAAVFPMDKVVSAGGKIVSAVPTIVVQPLNTAIVRSLDVHPGQLVQKGQLLARLDPTFASADLTSMVAQEGSLAAEVARLTAEAAGKPYAVNPSDPASTLQASIDQQRQAEYTFKMENYKQQIDSLKAKITRAQQDAAQYRGQAAVAGQIVQMRMQLQHDRVGSRLNTLTAESSLIEATRSLKSALAAAAGAQRDLDAMRAERDAFAQQWRADISTQLQDTGRKLADARQQLTKAQLISKLVVLRADRTAMVQTVAKVSVGSVMQSGQQLITLVPLDAPLEVEADINGSDSGYVQVGDKVSVKFNTLPFMLYGTAQGTVRTISADSFSPQDVHSGQVSQLPGQPNALFYRARITLDQIKLHDTPAGFHIMPGMPVSADIEVGKRTILDYIFSQVLPVTTQGMREP